MVKIYVCISRTYLVINVSNQGKTLCSPCIFTVHVPSLITVEFLVCSKSYCTTKARNVLQLVANFQKPRAGCKWVDRHQKCLDEVPLHFEYGLNAVGISSVPTDQNIKVRVQRYFGLYLEN